MLYQVFLAVQIDDRSITAVPLEPAAYGLIGGMAAECQVTHYTGEDEFRMMCVFMGIAHGDDLAIERPVLDSNKGRLVAEYRSDFRRLFIQ